MTLKFDYCSDLHVDAWAHVTQLHDRVNGPRIWTGVPYQSHSLIIDWEWYKTPDSTVLIIAGDLSNDLTHTIRTVKDAAAVYDQVVFVEGNHDHYQDALDGDIETNHKVIKDSLRLCPNVTHLDGEESVQVGATLFIGALGWYDWQGYSERGITAEVARDRWANGNNDSRAVDFGRFKDPSVRAMHDAEALRSQVIWAQDEESIENIVVVTHTSPRVDLMQWSETNESWNTMTPSFMNVGMDRVILADEKKKIRHWVYGHTHHRQVVDIDGVLYSNNARGYPRENETWVMTQHVVG